MNEGYICMTCGRPFEKPDEKLETHSENHVEQYDVYGYCPLCGSDDFTAADPCCICRKPTALDKLVSGVCPDCVDKLYTPGGALRAIRHGESDHRASDFFTADEIEEICLRELRDAVEMPVCGQQIRDNLRKTMRADKSYVAALRTQRADQ